MKDQAERLRSIANNLRSKIEADLRKEFKHTRVVAVTSGKGGVGKSNIAINLAIALAVQGNRVLIFDADLGLANVDIILGLYPRYNLYHVIKREKKLRDIIMDGPENIRIIPGGSGIFELANLPDKDLKMVLNELGQLDGEADYMIIDTGAGISNNVMNFILNADEVIVVTTPEPTSLTDAYGIIKSTSARESNPKINLIINRVTSETEGVSVNNKLKSVSEKFLGVELNLLGYIREDHAVEDAVKKQEPFILSHPTSRASQDIKKIAQRFSRTTAGSDQPEGLKKFFKSLAKYLR